MLIIYSFCLDFEPKNRIQSIIFYNKPVKVRETLMRILTTIFIMLFSTWLSAANVNKVVVFGDSLSDNGNLFHYMKEQLPMSPPYYEGRFSNGPVWIELLVNSSFAHDKKSHLLDYAFGGAGVSEDPDNLFSLHKQVDSYLLTHNDKAESDSLFAVWIGSNNYLALPEDEANTVKEVNDGISKELQRLVDHGAKYILVANLPDLGHVPAAKDFDEPELLSRLSKAHNEELERHMGDLKVKNPSIEWVFFDVYTEVNDMMNYPGSFGFTNVTDTCYEAAAQEPSHKMALRIAAAVQSKYTANACDGYLFFDPVHPSIIAHKIMAKRTREMLEDSGIHLG